MSKIVRDGYIIAASTDDEQYAEIISLIRNRPTAESGYAYRLKTDLTWELYELPIVEETSAYTEEQLTAMTNAELEQICEELGIASSMTKANMVELIMAKQNA